MAGYGASLDFDKEAMANLPTRKDPESTAARRALFRQADMNGNGITSLAECDRLIVTVLAIEGVKIMKPVINRAFHAARDVVPSVGSISPHYVDFHEFRYFLIYLQHYLELFLVFCDVDSKGGREKYTDRRISYPEFESAIPRLIEWGLEDDIVEQLNRDPSVIFRDMDDNGGGVVLFDEFAHWALWNHLFNLDGNDEADLEEALEVLKKQKPNLCGKDLSAIKASRAKYRADAKISGQGCLGGDPSLSGGYERIEDGGKELAAGRHYPGGLAAWKASFHGAGKDAPGKYRTVAQITAIYRGNTKASGKVGQMENGTEVEILEVVDVPSEKRIRARVEGGFISLLNTENGFRWAVRLRDRGDRTKAWKASLERCQEAGEDFMTNGVPECVNGCGQPRFGRYPTCCWHCKGPDGPHARDCLPKKYEECENKCGHPAFGKYTTCCTHCRGADGPHAKGCKAFCEEVASKEAGKSRGEKFKNRDVGACCANGCGRRPFRKFPTCCTHCKGPDGPHHRDCDQRVEDEAVRREIRNVFMQAKDDGNGMTHKRFRGLMRKLFEADQLEEMIKSCDKNDNGIIEISEFLDWMWSSSLSEDLRSEVVASCDI
jgi:hypothetical protein